MNMRKTGDSGWWEPIVYGGFFLISMLLLTGDFAIEFRCAGVIGMFVFVYMVLRGFTSGTRSRGKRIPIHASYSGNGMVKITGSNVHYLQSQLQNFGDIQRWEHTDTYEWLIFIQPLWRTDIEMKGITEDYVKMINNWSSLQNGN